MTQKNISPKGSKYLPTESQIITIQDSVDRAISFLASDEYRILNTDLNKRVKAVNIDSVASQDFLTKCLHA